MIVLRVKGGIGNQLFQYASAKGLAAAAGETLKLDVRTGFRRDSYQRAYRLGNFHPPEPTATPLEVLLARMSSLRSWRSLREAEAHCMLQGGEFFLPWLTDKLAQPLVYLEANLQSPHYFSGIESQLRGDLRKGLMSVAGDLDCSRLAGEAEPVSVHIRRKDYTRLLPVEYYRRAARIVRDRAPRAHFFVFGDDPAWAASELAWLDPQTIVRGSGVDDDLRDLARMACCRHHVIANSTFSWWGAWLAGHEHGVVIAPSWGWTANGSWPKDLFPHEWMVV